MPKWLSLLLVSILILSAAGCSFGLSGGDGINISGNESDSSITIGLDGSVVRGVLADTGNATGSGHWLKIEGAGNVSTSASGNVVTISFTGGAVSSDMSLAEGHLFVGNSSGLAQDMELSGDATLNGLGELDVTWADESQSADTANSAADSDKLDGLHGSSYLLGNSTTINADTIDGSHASAFLAVAGTAADSDKLDGLHGSSYLLGNSTTINADTVDGSHASAFLAAAGTAADSDKVDGSHASAFLAVAGTAADSDKLDGQHGIYYMRSSVMTVVAKSADETVNNSAVLQNDDELKLTVGANEVWVFSLYIPHYATATPDFKMGFTIPAGATFRWNTGAGGTWVWKESDTVAVAGSDALPERGCFVTGYIDTAGTAGTLQFTWAQNTATAVNTIVRAGSAVVAYQTG